MVEVQVALTRQIREANDIVAVIGSYLTLQRSGAIYKALCPFHNDTRPSLQVDPKYQNFRCWSCGKRGDVFTFVAEFEKVSFREARELLARRAGIPLTAPSEGLAHRSRMLEAMRWAEQTFHECLLESPLAERARLYAAERRLSGTIVRAFGLGFAPPARTWLTDAARSTGRDLDLLVNLGLIWRDEHGCADRFRDRLMFPIRDARGQTVGFGGRILPDSAFSDRGPKYYNSAETPLFSKKELLYGLDLARASGSHQGFLAVVEGYTDVLLAHQMGITNVVATMGTALNEAHVRQLRRLVPRVVLVFDADLGGDSGVDRAVEIFIRCDVDLAIASLPQGRDPCDLLVAEGPEAFRRILAGAVDALDFKLRQASERHGTTVDGIRRTVDEVLELLAQAPAARDQAGQVREELLVTRLAQRMGLRQETVWARLGELRGRRRGGLRTDVAKSRSDASVGEARKPARPAERELLRLLLAEPGLVAQAYTEVRPEEIEHPGLQTLLAALYRLYELGQDPGIDGLRELIDNQALLEWAIENRAIGMEMPGRQRCLLELLDRLREQRRAARRQQVLERMRQAACEEDRKALLRELQELDRGRVVGARAGQPGESP